jgi:hypothetical protein
VPPKRPFTQDLHGATSQKTPFFNYTVNTVKLINCRRYIYAEYLVSIQKWQ